MEAALRTGAAAAERDAIILACSRSDRVKMRGWVGASIARWTAIEQWIFSPLETEDEDDEGWMSGWPSMGGEKGEGEEKNAAGCVREKFGGRGVGGGTGAVFWSKSEKPSTLG